MHQVTKPLLLALLLGLYLMACGSDGGTESDGSEELPRDANPIDTDTTRDIDLVDVPPQDAATETDSGPEAVDWVTNLVIPGGPDDIQSFLDGASEDALYPMTTAFYERYADDFDFIYLLAEVDHGTGRYSTAHRPAMPANGLDSEASDAGWGSNSRLKGVVAMRLGASGNGPTLHETAHFWGVFLDVSFGFGQDRDTNFGPHWGVAGVSGQLGGFDPTTLQCIDGSMLPCTPEPSGRTQYTMAEFGPAANGGDVVPYAPIELYLMGLIPQSEVPSPIMVMRDASFIQVNPDTRFLFEAAGVDEVAMSDIIARHGEKPLLPADQRAFRGAFVLVTNTPASDEAMSAVRRWSRVFSSEESSGSLLGFEEATGGLATMDTVLVVP